MNGAAQQEHRYPPWARGGDRENDHIVTLFSVAAQNFDRHENWFLHYYSAGIKNLATVLAAETALIGLYFGNPRVVPDVVLFTLLSVFAIVGFLLRRLAITSCERAYMAAMESLVVMHKSAWALGLTSDVAVRQDRVDPERCPVPADVYLYGVRWLDGVLEPGVDTEAEFVARRIQDRNSTSAKAETTMWVLWLAVVAVGIAAAAALASPSS